MELKEIITVGLSCAFYIDKDSVNFDTYLDIKSITDSDSILLTWN